MDIIKIGDNALKVMMNADEAKLYCLDEEVDYSDYYTQKGIESVLHKVYEDTGIMLKDGKMAVSIYESKDGGCELFISRLDVEENMNREKVPLPDVKKVKTGFSVYCFDNIENILFTCSNLSGIQYKGKSSAYYDIRNGKYYLIIEEQIPRQLKYEFINEFGKQVKSMTIPYIKEHCKCICGKDGVKILGNLL